MHTTTSTAVPAPTTAERVRTALIRADTTHLAVDGCDPIPTTVHHLHTDDDVAIVVPANSTAVAMARRAATGLPAVLELTDHSPLALRNPVRSLIWLSGILHTVEEPRLLAAEIAETLPHPELLDVGHRSELLRLSLSSVVAADTTGAEAVNVVDVLEAAPDPFAALETAWLEHLEAEHADLVVRIARRIPEAQRGGRIRPLGIDRYGVRLRIESGRGDHDVRIPFGEPVADPSALSRALRLLAGCPFRNGLHMRS
ncbi:DUF2470 domain-containing protein [Rhodococcus coprophilus]|uniref:DUF2470 domain-containing protein n=1 Tax=Rhodococcus coprophilus TaxID=38310 RepID=A0A2X4U3S1_9NOCA|nr:DUF2470 domain-containing protein [Rhodococcus coprophilus]MBM7458709.1 hypothetical protein [Rhodococcus coprophilus]SQI33259.1 Uncharacterised protein [Rhodococcus coprophilus]